jgi:hypothetical protein
MSIFTTFDWLSPLIQAIQRGERIIVTPGQMNDLKNRGYKVHSGSAFEVPGSPGNYMVKVEPPSKERGLKIF